MLVVTGDNGVLNGTGTVRARGADAALDPSQYHPTSSFAGGGGGGVELPQRGLTVDVRGGGGCQRGGAGTVFYRAKAELDINNTLTTSTAAITLLDVSVEPSNISTLTIASGSVLSLQCSKCSAGEPIAVVTDSLVLRDHSELEVTHDIAAPKVSLASSSRLSAGGAATAGRRLFEVEVPLLPAPPDDVGTATPVPVP